jgi:hypothetical protein
MVFYKQHKLLKLHEILLCRLLIYRTPWRVTAVTDELGCSAGLEIALAYLSMASNFGVGPVEIQTYPTDWRVNIFKLAVSVS